MVKAEVGTYSTRGPAGHEAPELVGSRSFRVKQTRLREVALVCPQGLADCSQGANLVYGRCEWNSMQLRRPLCVERYAFSLTLPFFLSFFLLSSALLSVCVYVCMHVRMYVCLPRFPPEGGIEILSAL